MISPFTRPIRRTYQQTLRLVSEMGRLMFPVIMRGTLEEEEGHLHPQTPFSPKLA
jgi:hypothetical protein